MPGGTVRRIEGNLLYAERGTILTLEGKKVFFLGGGVSEDMDERLESGTWHSEEMPTAEELAAAEERLTQSGGVDLIITHQPSDRMRIFLGGDRTEISPLGAFLDGWNRRCSSAAGISDGCTRIKRSRPGSRRYSGR